MSNDISQNFEFQRDLDVNQQVWQLPKDERDVFMSKCIEEQGRK